MAPCFRYEFLLRVPSACNDYGLGKKLCGEILPDLLCCFITIHHGHRQVSYNQLIFLAIFNYLAQSFLAWHFFVDNVVYYFSWISKFNCWSFKDYHHCLQIEQFIINNQDLLFFDASDFIENVFKSSLMARQSISVICDYWFKFLQFNVYLSRIDDFTNIIVL